MLLTAPGSAFGGLDQALSTLNSSEHILMHYHIQEALLYFYNYGTLRGFSNSKPVGGKQIFSEDCDILVLAARHKTLPCYCADSVKAKIIVEATYDPVTPSAHKILTGHSKLVIPDLYINGGSSVASYYEYLIGTKYWTNRTLTKRYCQIYYQLPRRTSDVNTTPVDGVSEAPPLFDDVTAILNC